MRDKLSKVATLPLGVSIEQLELSDRVLLEYFLIALDNGEDNFRGVDDGVNKTKLLIEMTSPTLGCRNSWRNLLFL